MNSALDSALSILQGAFSSIVGAPLHEELDYHISKTSPNDRPTRKRDLQAAIADVDETVNSVRAIHDVVTVMLNTLRKKRAAFYHALQSPVHSLPNELLQRIFSELLQEAEGSDIVVALTHVCSSWRSAALGSGRLWEHVKVRTASSLLELVAHSAPHPFSLDLELPLGMSRGLSGSPMIYLLPKDAERLKSLSLGDSSILRRVGFPDSVILFNLQTLRLDAGLSLDFNPIPPLPSTLHSISKLMIHDWDRPRYVMNNSPWPQLTSIYFENSSVTSVARVLDRMAAPCLTNLFFAKMTDGFWTGFFNIMREPPRSIRSMSIIDSNHFIDAFATNFLLLPNLTSLTLVRLADETGCHWETLLQSLPNLTNFSIIHRPDNLDGLVELAVGLNGANQVRKLEVLNITRLFDVPGLLDGLPNLSSADRVHILRTSNVEESNLDDALPFVDSTNASTNPVAVALADALRQRIQAFGLPRLRRLVISHALGGGDNYFFWGLADVVTVPRNGMV